MTCDDCGEPMYEYEAPTVTHSFRLFKWELQLWTWGATSSCLNCAREHDAERENAAYDAGMRDGYKEAERLYHTQEP